eukprot:35557-Prorocentrum_minimum.AAC.1
MRISQWRTPEHGRTLALALAGRTLGSYSGFVCLRRERSSFPLRSAAAALGAARSSSSYQGAKASTNESLLNENTPTR